MVAVEIVRAWGHGNITATHRSTVEITKRADLSLRGDCIVGVRADKSVADLNSDFKAIVRREGSILVIIIKASGYEDIILAEGSSKLLLDDDEKIIIRKSSYVDRATLCVRANKSAADLDRRLVESLRNPATIATITLIALEKNELLNKNQASDHDLKGL